MLSGVNDVIFPQRNFLTLEQSERRLVAQRKTATKASGKGRKSTKTTKSTKTASRKAKASTVQKRAKKRSSAARDEDVTVCRRRSTGRRGEDHGEQGKPPVLAGPQMERRKKVSRRRQIDPTTCERDYTDDEIQFMNALDAYKRASGRMFPTCSEVLEVVRSLGYVRLSPGEMAAHGATSSSTPSTGHLDESNTPEVAIS